MAHLVGRSEYRPYRPAPEPVAAAEPAVGDVFLHPGVQAEVLPPSRRERLIDIAGFLILGLILAEVLVATWIAARWAILLVGGVLITGVLLLLHTRPHLPHHAPRAPREPLFPSPERR